MSIYFLDFYFHYELYKRNNVFNFQTLAIQIEDFIIFLLQNTCNLYVFVISTNFITLLIKIHSKIKM